MAKLTEPEYEKKVAELGKKGITSEKIGLELKKEKIFSKDYKKSIGKILKQANIPNTPDINNIKNRVEILKKHAEKHKQDKTFKRALSITSAKLRKLEKIQNK